MALKQALTRGDWVKATSKTGSVIVGQAGHDMPTFGYSVLTVVVGGDSAIALRESPIWIEINVNFWDVDTIYQNMIGA